MPMNGASEPLRSPINRLRHLADTTWKIYRVARGPAEKADVVAFTARYVADQVRQPAGAAGERSLVLQGLRFFVGPGELIGITEIMLDRCYDQLPSFVPGPGWSVVDVGANVGAFSMLQARRGASVHSFEPNPGCFRRLSAAVTANGLGDQVKVHNQAVSDRPGRARFRVTDGCTLLGSLAGDPGPDEPAGSYPVDVVALDEALSGDGVGHVDLLKIDVEGAELKVLAGAEATLDAVDRVVMEYHPGVDPVEVDAALAPHGLSRALHRSTNPGWGLLYYGR